MAKRWRQSSSGYTFILWRDLKGEYHKIVTRQYFIDGLTNILQRILIDDNCFVTKSTSHCPILDQNCLDPQVCFPHFITF